MFVRVHWSIERSVFLGWSRFGDNRGWRESMILLRWNQLDELRSNRSSFNVILIFFFFDIFLLNIILLLRQMSVKLSNVPSWNFDGSKQIHRDFSGLIISQMLLYSGHMKDLLTRRSVLWVHLK